jgi:glycosyltransferase involved in cell wall biosynthesis
VLSEVGVDARVIPLPVSPSDAVRADNGQTLLALGVIRPYKGLADAIEVTRRLPDARLLVAGDPAMPLDGLRDAPRTEWRLGYLPDAEVDRTLAESTVALFPYRPELDQSAALLQALGAGVPAVVYDVGGLGEPIRRFGAGRVVPAGDVEALTEATRELLSDSAALAAARAGADRARAELTWDSSAAQHLELYRELL